MSRRAARVVDQAIRPKFRPQAGSSRSSLPAVAGFDAAALVARFGSLVAIALVVERFAEDWDEGFKASSMGGPGGKGGVSRPVESAVIAPYRTCMLCGGDTPCADHPDESAGPVWAQRAGHGLADDAARLVHMVEAIGAYMDRAVRLAERLAPLNPEIAHELAVDSKAHKIGAGGCQCCSVGVSGVGSDRVKKGYCPACYEAYKAAGRPDRGLFEARRRAELKARAGKTGGKGETAGPSLAAADGVLLGATGGELRPAAS